MDQSVAVVTGATSGIGRFIALGLAQAGHHVVLVGRNQARGEAVQALIAREAPGAGTEFLAADLSSLGTTRTLGKDLVARHGRIAVLVNNAGTFLTRREVTPEGHERVLATNHLSPWVLTSTLLPALRQAGAARVVNVGSSASDHAGIDPDDLELVRGWGLVRAYSRSKLALMTSSFVLAERLAGSGVTVNVVHPGPVATGLVRSGGVVGLAWRAMAPFLLTEQQGAATPLHVALAPALAGTTGQYFKRCREAVPNRRARDRTLAARVQAATERLAA